MERHRGETFMTGRTFHITCVSPGVDGGPQQKQEHGRECGLAVSCHLGACRGLEELVDIGVAQLPVASVSAHVPEVVAADYFPFLSYFPQEKRRAAYQTAASRGLSDCQPVPAYSIQ